MSLHTFHDVEINSPDFTGNKDLHTVSINDNYNDELFICIKRITGIQNGYAKFWEKMGGNFDLIKNLKPNFDFFEKTGQRHHRRRVPRRRQRKRPSER